jgi:predicted dehydrogenase
MRQYPGVLPEFVDRFGPAYKAEIATFIDCCLAGSAFPTTHRDGVRAQEVISAGMKAVVGPDAAYPLRSL